MKSRLIAVALACFAYGRDAEPVEPVESQQHAEAAENAVIIPVVNEFAIETQKASNCIWECMDRCTTEFLDGRVVGGTRFEACAQ